MISENLEASENPKFSFCCAVQVRAVDPWRRCFGRLFFSFRDVPPANGAPPVAGAGLLGVALGPALVPALGSGLRAVVKSGLGLLPGATADAGASSGHALRHRTALSCLSGAEGSGDDADNDDDNDGDDDGDDDYGSEGSGVNFGSRTYKQKPGSLGRAPSAQVAAAAAHARNIAQTKARTAELELASQVCEAREAAFAERQERAKRKSFRAGTAHSAAEKAVAAAEELEIATTAALETARAQKKAALKTADYARFRADCLEEEDSLSSSSNAADPPLSPPPSPGAGGQRARGGRAPSPPPTTAPGPLSGNTLGRGRCAELDQRAPLQLWSTAHSIDRRDTN